MKLGKTALTSLLVAALAVGSSVLVIATRDRATSGELEQRKKNLLPVWRADEITRLELGAAARIVLQREPGDGGETQWQIAEPLKEPANPDAVERLIATLGFAAPLRPSEQSAQAAGIDQNSPSIAVTMGAVRYELRLGKNAGPPSGARYVSVVAQGGPGTGLSVIAADSAKLFATTLDELRRRQLWPYGPTTLRELALEGPAGKLDWVKNAAGSFTLRGGKRANRDVVEPLIASLVGLDLQRFLDPALARSALAAGPRFAVRGSSATGPDALLELGGKCPDDPDAIVALRDGRIAACVDAAILTRLQPSPDAVIDRRPFSVRPDEVEELTLTQGDKKLDLVRKSSGFRLRAPSEADVALDAGNGRVTAVVGAEASIVEQPDLVRLGLEPAAGRATVTSPGEGKAFTETVAIGRKQPDGGLYLRRDDGVVLSLGRDAARAFAIDTTLLRSLKLLDFTAAELESLTVAEPTAQKLVRNAEDRFELEAPRGFAVDTALATDLSFELGSLSALRWIADADDGSFGLEKPQARVVIGFRAGDAGQKQRTLIVGAATSGGHYARFEDDPAVFVIERELVEHLGTLLVNRSEFMFDPASVTRLELSRHGDKIVLAARSGSLAALEPKDLPPGQLQVITDTLGTLRAEAALHTGPARPEEGLAKPELEVRVERKSGGPTRTFTIGAADSWRGESIYYARISGVDATFVISRSKVRPLLDAF